VRLALLLIGITLLLAAPASATTRVGRCEVPSKARVEAAGGRVIVWSLDKVDRDGDPFVRVFACRRSSGARAKVTETIPYLFTLDELRAFRVAGRYVAYVHDFRHRCGQDLLVLVFDAYSRNHVRRRYAAFDPPFGDCTTSSIEALVLARDASFVYVVRHDTDIDHNLRPRVRVGLRAVDGEESRLLDKGDGIDPASVRLEGSTVHWTSSGEGRSAPLR
jgi:hypothetical protein